MCIKSNSNSFNAFSFDECAHVQSCNLATPDSKLQAAAAAAASIELELATTFPCFSQLGRCTSEQFFATLNLKITVN